MIFIATQRSGIFFYYYYVKVMLKLLICLAMSWKMPTFAADLETTSIND